MSAATIEKIVWTVIAVAIYALTAWPPMLAVAEPLKVLAGIIIGKAWLQSVDEKHATRARESIAPKIGVGIVFLLLAVLVMLSGCGEKPPVVDAAALQRNVDSLDASASAVALDAAKLRPDIEIVCAFDARACAIVEAGYEGVEVGVDNAHKLIAILAEFGQGLGAAQVAVAQVEAASKKLAALVASAVEVAHGSMVAEPGRSAGDAGEQPTEPEQASGAGAASTTEDPADGAGGGTAPAGTPEVGAAP